MLYVDDEMKIQMKFNIVMVMMVVVLTTVMMLMLIRFVMIVRCLVFSVLYALRVIPAVTRLTVYRRLRVLTKNMKFDENYFFMRSRLSECVFAVLVSFLEFVDMFLFQIVGQALCLLLESDGLICPQWWTGCAFVHSIGFHFDLVGWIEWCVARGVFICAGELACIFVGGINYI